jgi:1,4-alpha-glucan branching enzyme
MNESDRAAFAQGKHHRAHDFLGAHVCGDGVAFAVWAPNATSVSVVGDFNDWHAERHPMRTTSHGIWQRHVSQAAPGALYKFAVCGADGITRLKADPFGREMERRPATASRVAVSNYSFGDARWIERRGKARWDREPMSIYEVYLGAWRHATDGRHPPWLRYDELSDALIDHVSALGFTHIELLPLMEHPLDASWGYQVSGYFAPTSRYGSPDALRAFIDRCHGREVGVILDWVPAHFPKDEFALGRFDGTPLFEHPDPRRGEHREWGTYIFDYGRPEVQSFLISNALYWFEEFHVDALRVDAVASMLYLDYGANHPDEWVTNEHGGRENLEAIAWLRALSEAVHKHQPGCLLIAEESTAWPGVTDTAAQDGLGFDLKWNMGWMHDTLSYFAQQPVHRKHHHDAVTFGLSYAFSERFVLPLSHDEVVHLKRSLLAKMPGDEWQQHAQLRSLLAHMWAHPGKKLIFMGAELAQDTEFDETSELPWALMDEPRHAGTSALLSELNRLYRERPALQADHEAATFEWVVVDDADQSVLAYLRFAVGDAGERLPDEHLLCVMNATPVVRHDYRLGVPTLGRYVELLNSDARAFGGSDAGSGGGADAEPVASHGQPASIRLTLPPLGVVWLAPESPP